jgi:hypothetical protein
MQCRSDREEFRLDLQDISEAGMNLTCFESEAVQNSIYGKLGEIRDRPSIELCPL